MKNKAFNILFISSIVLFVADMVTTLWNFTLIEFLETNPIYRATGSIVPIVLLNVAVFAALYWGYTRDKSGSVIRYLSINSLVWIFIARVLALKNNIYWVTHQVEAKAFAVAAAADPIMHQEAVKLTQESLALNTLPLLVGLIVFLIWLCDHKVERREGNEKCKKKNRNKKKK